MTDIHPTPTSTRVPDPPRFTLIVFGNDTVRELALHRSRLTVGRASDCDLVLADPSVSRRHVVLEPCPAGVRFHDLGGTNMPLLDGEIRSEGLLRVGSSLLVGMTRLELREGQRPPLVRVDHHVDATAFVDLPEDWTPPTPVAGDRDAATPYFVAALEAVSWEAPDNNEIERTALAILRSAMRLTRRRAGMVALLPTEAPVRILAAERRGTGPEFALWRDTIERCRQRRAPFLVPGDDGDRRKEQIVVPFGPGPAAVLVLLEPDEDACDSRSALAIARALGGTAWRALHGVRIRVALRNELEHLRFARTSAFRTVAASPRLGAARRQLAAAAMLDAPVILIGEEGTEREDLARYYHSHTEVSAGPFVRFYASLVPAQQAETRLFGIDRSPGSVETSVEVPALERARGGTLFVDAPEQLSAGLQRRLAEVLERRQGPSSAAVLPRIVVGISPAHDDEESTMVPELRRALSGSTVLIPELRGHPDDVHMLLEATLGELGPGPEGAPRSVSETARRQLVAYDWPGNTRQLQRVIESAAVRAGATPIGLRHLPEEVRAVAERAPRIPTLAEMERRHIETVLNMVGDNKRRAAQILGIASSTLYEKLKRYGND